MKPPMHQPKHQAHRDEADQKIIEKLKGAVLCLDKLKKISQSESWKETPIQHLLNEFLEKMKSNDEADLPEINALISNNIVAT